MKNLVSKQLKQSKRLLNWLIPPHCIICKVNKCPKNQLHCRTCDIQASYRLTYCQVCGQAFAAMLDHCGRCLAHAPAFDACICPFEFSGAIKNLIWRFKYQQQPYLAKPLAHLFCKELELVKATDTTWEPSHLKNIANTGVTLPDAIISVPSHPISLRQRGYNQSNLLAIEIAKQLKIPVYTDILRKTRHTQSQTTLDLNQRKNNVKHSFEIIKPLQVQHLAIVDDVITTNATMSEISKTLKKNGVDYIQAWGIAHTP